MNEYAEKPKPLTWCLWTLFFAWLTVKLNGTWWQVLGLFLLAGSGGTWAVENERWRLGKAASEPSGWPRVPDSRVNRVGSTRPTSHGKAVH